MRHLRLLAGRQESRPVKYFKLTPEVFKIRYSEKLLESGEKENDPCFVFPVKINLEYDISRY